MRLVSAIIALSLSACAAPSPDAVLIKWHRTEQAWLEVSKHVKVTNKDMFTMQGYAYFDGTTCHVFAPDPKMKEVAGKKFYTNDQWAVLGHEVKHCFDGAFHKNATKE